MESGRRWSKLEENEQYDLKQSLKEIGVLYPALADKKGRIIDGLHRLAVDSKWPIFVLSDIDSDEKYLVARIVANTHRRVVPAEEKTKWLDELAEKTGWSPEEIARKVGMSENWVRKYLSDKYKIQVKVEAGRISGEARRVKKENLFHAVEQNVDATVPSAPSPSSSGRELTVSTSTPAPLPTPSRPANAETEKTTVTRDPRLKYIEGLNLWFIPPSNPVMTALYDYCIEKEVDWRIAVVLFLGKCLVEEGFLEKEKLAETLKPFETE